MLCWLPGRDLELNHRVVVAILREAIVDVVKECVDVAFGAGGHLLSLRAEDAIGTSCVANGGPVLHNLVLCLLLAKLVDLGGVPLAEEPSTADRAGVRNLRLVLGDGWQAVLVGHRRRELLPRDERMPQEFEDVGSLTGVALKAAVEEVGERCRDAFGVLGRFLGGGDPV